jgi:forkhead box protein K
MERSADGKGKGFFWSVDAKFEHMFEEQEAKGQAGKSQDNEGGKDGKPVKKKDKGGASLLEPPLKRSVKGDMTGAPLPPPLTSTPLPMKTSAPSLPTLGPALSYLQKPFHPNLVPSAPVKSEPLASSTSFQFMGANLPHPNNTSGSSSGPATPLTTPSIPTLPPSLYIPIVVGPIPASHPSSSLPTDSTNAPLTSTAIVLHESTLILNPDVFSHLTPEQVKELEALGAQKALEILQGYIARFLKEQRLKRREGGRGRGRGRGIPKRSRDSGRIGNEGNSATAESPAAVNGATDGKAAQFHSGPFTTAPLPPRNLQAQPSQETGNRQVHGAHSLENDAVPVIVDATPPVPIPTMAAKAPDGEEDTIVVVDDSDSSEAPMAKKRKLDIPDATGIPGLVNG